MQQMDGGAALAPTAQLRTRTLEVRDAGVGPERASAGRPLVNFCSNDYLGLASSTVLRDAAIAAVERYGVGAGAAALLSGWTVAHHELAIGIADYLQRDRALLFSSGYLANLGVLAALAGRHDEIFHDRLNHASLIDGVRLSGARSTRYRHADTADLERRLQAAQGARRLVVTDGVFSMDGDCAPLAEVARLARAHEALLVCDDAHGFGVLGNGRGLPAELGLTQQEVPLLVVTFGKSLGTAGAAVVGRADLIESLQQNARTFIYDTACPPAVAAASSAALGLLRQDASLVTRLAANIAYFHAGLRRAGLAVPASRTPIQPVVLGDDARTLAAAQSLRERGYYVRAIRPPTVPEGTSRLRICLSAAHTEAQIDGLVGALQQTLGA
jgi:8-amino-7-oxononanoate synthase